MQWALEAEEKGVTILRGRCCKQVLRLTSHESVFFHFTVSGGKAHVNQAVHKAVPFLLLLWYTVPYRTIPYHTVPHRTTPYHTVPHHVSGKYLGTVPT